jgi:hypothetical protein
MLTHPWPARMREPGRYPPPELSRAAPVPIVDPVTTPSRGVTSARAPFRSVWL